MFTAVLKHPRDVEIVRGWRYIQKDRKTRFFSQKFRVRATRAHRESLKDFEECDVTVGYINFLTLDLVFIRTNRFYFIHKYVARQAAMLDIPLTAEEVKSVFSDG